MCRIAGVLHYGNTALEADVLRMREAMRRGGPDDAGIYTSRKYPFILAHRRLAILDTSAAGHQPMCDSQHRLVISYNGEIYNFRALKTELAAFGHQFQSETDTEVILKAYIQWGPDSFRRFNGMFAFALLDEAQDLLFLVRDPAGIKPLYYRHDADQLVFASEIRAFRALKPDWPENDHWRILFLTFGFLPEPNTTLKGVTMLPAGNFLKLEINSGRAVQIQFFRQEIRQEFSDEPAVAAQLSHTIRAATQSQLVSDVPVGLFLSGGIDSSILALSAWQKGSFVLNTASVLFEEQQFNEKYFQDMMVQAVEARHTAVTLGRKDFDAAFDDIRAAMDQPTNDGINTYFVCRAAKAAGLTVALSGLGADELFGGYPSFDYARYVSPLRGLPPKVLRALARKNDYRWKKISFLNLPGAVGEYLFYRGLFAPEEVARVCGVSENTVTDRILSLPSDPQLDALKDGNRVSWMECKYYMQNQLLRDTDSMSMWHSLEVRVPFLDRSVTDLAWRISEKIKFRQARKKDLLIRAFETELPRAVWDRPKQGFTFPFASWFRSSEQINKAATGLGSYLDLFNKGQLSWARLWVYFLARHL